MKFLILLLISFNVFAGSWLPESKVCDQEDGLTSFRSQKKCQDHYSESCINARGEDLSACKVRAEKWLKDLAESCSDEADCQSKLEALVCSDDEWQAIKTENEVYCTKFRPKKIVQDDDKKAIKDAEKAAKDQEKADRKAEIQELRGHIQDINDSDLPGWHKKILRRLIRELKD